MHMRLLAEHLQSWLGILFPVYDLLTPHNHGPPRLPYCGSNSACRLVKNGPRKSARFFGQPACHPTTHRIFIFLLSWWSAGRLCWLLSVLGVVPASVRLESLMYVWRCPLKYFSSSDSISFCFGMYSGFNIWRHWYTWDAWCWMYLGTSAAASFSGTGASCRVWDGRWKSCPVTVWYVAGCIASPSRPCFPPPNSDCMVDAFALTLRWISRIIL